MSHAVEQNTALRVGIFSTMRQAERVVEALQAAGFTEQQITVICSNEMRQAHFREFEHQVPGSKVAPGAVAVGGIVGATLGGLATVVAALATGGAAILFTGAAAAWAGAVVGGLVGGMMTRGIDRELADYYDQAVAQGKILVAVEDHTSTAKGHLSAAERIFAENGALPLALPEG